MTRLILVSAAQNVWWAENRLAGDTNVSLTDQGRTDAAAHVERLKGEKPAALRCGPELGTKQTATIIAHALGLRVKSIEGLRELRIGLWAGLTDDELEERFPKAARMWRADPSSVQPPEGELLSAAADRLSGAIKRIVKRHADETVVVVLGPYAWAIAFCKLRDGSIDGFWDCFKARERMAVIERT